MSFSSFISLLCSTFLVVCLLRSMIVPLGSATDHLFVEEIWILGGFYGLFPFKNEFFLASFRG